MTDLSESDRERLLQEKGLAFFGAITASVSHELNNVISIIDQTAGLLEDLLIGAQSGRAIEPERLARVAESIANQTNRGVKIIKRLNTFAHSADSPDLEFEPNELVRNLMALSQRFADMKRVELEVRYADSEIKLTGSPFRIQQAVFLPVRWLLSVAPAGERITVSVEQRGDGACLIVEGPAAAGGETFDLRYLELLVDRSRGTLETRSESGRTVFELIIAGNEDSR
jgi:signal transduction histidine kinase